MKNMNKKVLSIAVSSAMTLAVCQSVSVQASDIEIYKTADKSKVTLMMTVDLSSSMSAASGSSLYYDYGLGTDLCPTSTSEEKKDPNANITVANAFPNGITEGSTSTGYKRIYCKVNVGTETTRPTVFQSSYVTSARNKVKGYTQGDKALNAVITGCDQNPNNNSEYFCYSRLTRLKDALFKVYNDSRWDSVDYSNSYKIGLSVFAGGEKKGYIVVPAAEMTATQIANLKAQVASLNWGYSTPTGYGYSEVASYLYGTKTDQTDNFSSSSTNTKNGSIYQTPLTNGASTSCRGDGIYFLTDGKPAASGVVINATQTEAVRVTMAGTLNDTVKKNFVSTANSFSTEWAALLSYSRALNLSTFGSTDSINSNYNKLPIRTAVAGFGTAYKQLTPQTLSILKADNTREDRTFYNCAQNVSIPFAELNSDKTLKEDPDLISVQNSCRWGQRTPNSPQNSDGSAYSWVAANSGYGEGGFYPVMTPDDVVKSVFQFADDLKPIIPEVATGSPVVPVDNLNSLQLQPYGYYASFTPTPQESYQLWAGNLNKYHVKDGMLYGSDKSTLLLKLTGEFNTEAQGLWAGGVKGRLPLGTGVDISNNNYSKRTIYTNRKLTGTTAAEDTSLHKVNLESLFSADTTKGLFASDPKKNYWLNALGYNVAEGATGITLTNLPTVENRQVGAVMHSTPILLTQQGKIALDKSTKQLVTTNRKDYLLFGSTQGSLHVVKAGNTNTDATGGTEVFAFIPNEMMENYPKAFLPKEATNLGKSNLFYGIDAPWTAYTQYVTKSDGTSTVNDSGRKVDNSADALALKGLQWVYGGLRMGGRSYYALDLSDIDKPSLKFHINPAANTTGPLSYMGESWSKPTIAYVNWGGEKKLVMFVGGGYDDGYEAPNYDQTTKKGAGVYMFDANNGDLLWWASANASASSAASTNSGVISTKNDDLKYSVVSQINAVDRNNDGLVDHLYFGDLGGQAFRIDLDNNAATKGAFTKRVFRLLNLHVTGGASPRFYEAPSFSIASGVDGKFATVAFSSGNRSNPLAGVETSGTTVSANDGVFVVYDNDVARSDLYTTTTLRTPVASTSLITLDLDKNGATATDGSPSGGVPQRNSSGYNAGWQYLYSDTAGKYKGLNGLYALDGYLYVNVFHKDGAGISGACNSGVRGDSYVYQFCLPYGRCPFTLPSSTVGAPNSSSHVPYSSKLGAGILGSTLGTHEDGFSNVVANDTDCTNSANKNKIECQIFESKVGLKQLRWYESR